MEQPIERQSKFLQFMTLLVKFLVTNAISVRANVVKKLLIFSSSQGCTKSLKAVVRP
jgi:hypothetical protein